MVEAFFSSPYAAIGAVLLACFGGYIAYRVNQKGRLATAAATFRTAFTDVTLNLTEVDTPSAQIVHVFRIPHLAAIQSFRNYVPRIQRGDYDKATEHYRQCCDTCLEGGVFALVASESTDYAKNNRQALLESIHRLLSYAQQT